MSDPEAELTIAIAAVIISFLFGFWFGHSMGSREDPTCNQEAFEAVSQSLDSSDVNYEYNEKRCSFVVKEE